MSEQIVDLIEAVMPGPRGLMGSQGPQGLPGVDAVPADEAVAAYVLGDCVLSNFCGPFRRFF